MNEILLLKGNPSRRKSRKRRSPAQRAATRRMLAANRSRFGHNPTKKKSRKRRSTAAVRYIKRNTPTFRKAARRIGRSRRYRSVMGSGITGMLKNGAIAGAGALTVDVGMGLLAKAMPGSSYLTPVNADGSVNYMYYLARGGMIYGLAKFGGRITRHANTMAAGALAVMGYQLMRSFMPSDGSIPLGYFNPGRIVSGGRAMSSGNLGRIMRNPAMGRIMALPQTGGKGAAASNLIRNMAGVTTSSMRVR